MSQRRGAYPPEFVNKWSSWSELDASLVNWPASSDATKSVSVTGFGRPKPMSSMVADLRRP